MGWMTATGAAMNHSARTALRAVGVALAGVLCAVLLGILAARIDERIGLVRRIQAYRHIDDH